VEEKAYGSILDSNPAFKLGEKLKGWIISQSKLHPFGPSENK